MCNGSPGQSIATLAIVFLSLAFAASQADALSGPRRVVLFGANHPPTTLDPNQCSPNLTLANGNLTITAVGTGNNRTCRSIATHTMGRYYSEFTVGTLVSNLGGGLADASFVVNSVSLGSTTHGIAYYASNIVFYNNGTIATLAAYAAGNTVSIAADLNNRNIWWRVNCGNWNNNASNNPSTNTGGITLGSMTPSYYVGFAVLTDTDSLTANFGKTAYSCTPPAGFSNW